MINLSARQIGTVEFRNGNQNTLHLGSNRNTGERIVWQQVRGRRPARVTGRNVGRLVAELRRLLADGEARWVEGPDQVALDALLADQDAPCLLRQNQAS